MYDWIKFLHSMCACKSKTIISQKMSKEQMVQSLRRLDEVMQEELTEIQRIYNLLSDKVIIQYNDEQLQLCAQYYVDRNEVNKKIDEINRAKEDLRTVVKSFEIMAKHILVLHAQHTHEYNVISSIIDTKKRIREEVRESDDRLDQKALLDLDI